MSVWRSGRYAIEYFVRLLLDLQSGIDSKVQEHLIPKRTIRLLEFLECSNTQIKTHQGPLMLQHSIGSGQW